MKTKLLFLFILLQFSFPLFAQDYTSSIDDQEMLENDFSEEIFFHLQPVEKTFMSTYKDNIASVNALSEIIRRNFFALKNNQAYLLVKGYSSVYNNTKKDLDLVKISCNHVKSFFMIHENMKEEYYKTYNSANAIHGRNDVLVVVSLRKAGSLDSIDDELVSEVETNGETSVSEDPKDTVRTTEVLVKYDCPDCAKQKIKRGPFVPIISVGTNFLYWAGVMPNFKHYTFTPNISAEVYFANRYSIYTSFDCQKGRDTKDGYFGMSQWAVEPRFWFNNSGQFTGLYAGLYAQVGDFDVQDSSFKDVLGDTGDFYGAGLSVGASFMLNKYVGTDFGLNVGYQNRNYDGYTYENKTYYAEYRSHTQNFFGVTGAHISLIFRWGYHKTEQ